MQKNAVKEDYCRRIRPTEMKKNICETEEEDYLTMKKKKTGSC